ncbi:hypothetical protein [Bacillus sp. ISL-55]|uniref:hypothetical protein n=1 Tax=Bacillus sp. ISL-55 TaxID=2819134 RepID=UPI001BE6C08E|nr:hypothetical protein [Bacillus sp. ISL-55]MBT2695462.1 hypothetical protein [Bacillus sp. ISL-55]
MTNTLWKLGCCPFVPGHLPYSHYLEYIVEAIGGDYDEWLVYTWFLAAGSAAELGKAGT